MSARPRPHIGARYTRLVEIGAFRAERGLTQRIRFNVVLEVSRHTAARDDDVDKVISSTPSPMRSSTRSPRSASTSWRRSPSASPALPRRSPRRSHLHPAREARPHPGCTRRRDRPQPRADASTRLRAVEAAGALRGGTCPHVVYLAPEVAAGADSAHWRDTLAAWGRPHVICLGPAIRSHPATPRRSAGSVFSPSSRRLGASATAIRASLSPPRGPSSTGR